MSLDNPSIQEIRGDGRRFAIVAARYNQALVDSLVAQATATLIAAGAADPLIERVPGAAELPYAAATLAAHIDLDAIIAIGVVIAGETNHHKVIGDSTAVALQSISLQQKMPVINGILVVNHRAQAEARVGTSINRGNEFAQAALEMAQFTHQWKTTHL